MKKFGYIYKITNTKSNRCYVGFTENPDVRWYEHQAAEHSDTMPLHKAIRDEGKEHFRFELLYKSENIKHTLFVMEPFFIGLHRSHSSVGGYNVNFGGDHPFLNRDGYVILLQSNDLSNCDSTIANDGSLPSDDLPKDVDYSAWTKESPNRRGRKVHTDTFERNRCLSLMERINRDGKIALGKFYLLNGDNIMCFNSREKFIAQCNKIPGCSPMKLIQNAKNMNSRGERLSYELLRGYKVRGVFAVFVVEHLLVRPPSDRRRRRNNRQNFKKFGIDRHSFTVQSSVKRQTTID
jgi:hypothetical protein